VSDEGTNHPQDRPPQEWSSRPTPEPPPGPHELGPDELGPQEFGPEEPGPQGYGPPTAPQGYGPTPAYQQPPYGQPAYGPPQGQIQFSPAGPTVEHPQATLAFVLGLLSVIGLTILGPFGWYYGNKIVNEIDRDPRAYSNRGLAMAGKVLGIIGTVMLAFIVVLVIGVIIVAVLASTTSSSTTPGY